MKKFTITHAAWAYAIVVITWYFVSSFGEKGASDLQERVHIQTEQSSGSLDQPIRHEKDGIQPEKSEALEAESSNRSRYRKVVVRPLLAQEVKSDIFFEGIEPIEFVAFPDFSLIGTGDTVELLIDDSLYSFSVLKTRKGADSLTIIGVGDKESLQTIVISMIRNRTRITVSTTDGTYEIVGDRKGGHVYLAGQIESKRIAYGKSDVVD